MPEKLVQRVLTHVTDRRYAPASITDLAEDLGLAPQDVDDLRQVIERLIEEKHIVLGDGETVVLPPPGAEVTGEFRAHERGFGFLVPDTPLQHGDLFVPPGQTMDAMTGDRVRAKTRCEPGRGKDSGKSPYTARVIEVLKRADKKYAGTLVKRDGKFFVEPDGRAFTESVFVRDPSIKNAVDGDKVLIELIEYAKDMGRDRPKKQAEGVILEVLGAAGEPDVETIAVIHAYGLEEGFDELVMAEARTAAKSLDDTNIPANRMDLTKTFVCTIDPPTAKDFDDAISLTKFDKQQDDGATWELGVHIADVAHFVTPGSALDETALRRGNSTYLPQRVLPMLPEVLSNGVCSLQPNVRRYTKSVFIRYSSVGKVLGFQFRRAVINSAFRMTYLEAQALIDGDLREAMKQCKTLDEEGKVHYPRELLQTVKLMDELAKVIRRRRKDDGMIVLGLPDVELIFDERGRVIDAEPEDDAFTHQLIEAFMVEANEAAATLFDNLNVPMIRRTHPEPESNNTDALRGFARIAGFMVPKNPDRKQLQLLLEATRGKSTEHAVNLAVLKTLTRAEYSPAIIGHFALASEHYTHFTSPIRRYPDLVVHRGLEAYLDATDNGNNKDISKKDLARKISEAVGTMDESALRDLGRHCSTTERNSESAERELRQYLVLELLQNHIGEDFGGTVTGVTHRGLFVQIDKYLCDGFIQTRDLPTTHPGERWIVDGKSGCLIGQRSNSRMSIGQRITVRIATVDLPRRQIELVVLPSGKTSKAKPPRTGEPGARGQGKKPQGSGGQPTGGGGRPGKHEPKKKKLDRNRYKVDPRNPGAQKKKGGGSGGQGGGRRKGGGGSKPNGGSRGS